MRQGRRVKIKEDILKSSSLDVADGLEMFLDSFLDVGE